MNFQPLFNWAYSFYLQYSIFCYVIGGVVLLLVFWKPLKVLKSILLMLVLALILYLCFIMTQSVDFSIGVKEKAIHRTEKAIEK